jgi:hypothetical protein
LVHGELPNHPGLTKQIVLRSGDPEPRVGSGKYLEHNEMVAVQGKPSLIQPIIQHYKLVCV